MDAVYRNDREAVRDIVANTEYYDLQQTDLLQVQPQADRMQTVFHIACERGYHEVLEDLMQALLTTETAATSTDTTQQNGDARDILLTCTDVNGLTPLQLACIHAHSECVSVILRYCSLAPRLGLRLIVQSDPEHYILHHPFLHHNAHTFSALYDIDDFLAARNVRDYQWHTFDTETRDRGCSIMDKVSHAHMISSLQPIHLSCVFNRREVLEQLHAFHNSVESEERARQRMLECLCLAAFCGSVECVRFLLDSGCRINGQLLESHAFSSPLFYACINRQQEAFGFLVERGAIIKVTQRQLDQSALPAQLLLKCYPLLVIMKLCAGREFVLNAFINTFRFRISGALMVTLFVLCGALHPELCKFIHQQEDIPFDAVSADLQMQAIHFAARTGTLSDFKALIAMHEDWDLNAVTEGRGRTALHEAAMSDNFEVVDYLLDLGADFTIVDNDNWSPLRAALEHAQQCSALVLHKRTMEIARQWRRDKIQSALLKRFRDLRDQEKDLDLFISALLGRRKLALTSFKNKLVDVDMQLLRGTALHYCCFRLDERMSAIDENMTSESVARHQHLVANGLIQLGSKLHTSGESFPDPLRTAIANDREDMVQLLLQKGADFMPIVFEMLEQQEQHEKLARWMEVIAASVGTRMDLTQGLDSERQRTVLHHAAHHKCFVFFHQIVHQLLANEHRFSTHGDSHDQTPLHLLALSRVHAPHSVDQGIAETLLGLGVEPGKTDHNGHTAVFYALVHARFGILEALISLYGSSSLDERNDRGQTPLQELMDGQLELLSHADACVYLLQHGVDTSVRDHGGHTLLYHFLHRRPLLHACLHQLDQQALERAFLRVDSQTGDNVLHTLPSSGHRIEWDTVEILARFNLLEPLVCAKNHNGDTPLHVYFRAGDDLSHIGLSMLQRAVHKVDINAKDGAGNTLLMLALQHVSDMPTIEYILSLHPDIHVRNTEGMNALDIAAMRNPTDDQPLMARNNLIAVLLERGSAVNHSTMERIPQSVLQTHLSMWDIGTCLQRGHVGRVRELIAHGASVNVKEFDEYRRPPLLIAAHLGDLDMVKLLVDSGADRGIVDSEENTALHIAAMRGNVDICRCLLADRKHAIESGAVHAQNKMRRTPLHVALAERSSGVDAVVRLLLERGASVSSRDIELRTALHLHCQDNELSDTSLAELIIERDTQSLGQCDKYGMTAFHLAAQADNAHLVRALLKHRDLFDMYLRDRNDRCAIEYAVSDEVRDIIRQHHVRGWLSKKGEKGLVKLYRRRWFVMDEERIRYYRQSDEREQRGHIEVDNIRNVRRSSGSSLRFDIFMRSSAGGRVYELQADNKEEFDKWFLALVRRRMERR